MKEKPPSKLSQLPLELLPVRTVIRGFPPEKTIYHPVDIPEGRFSSAAVTGCGDTVLDYAIILSSRMGVSVYSLSGFDGASANLVQKAVGTLEYP
ncbi:hypothetical protein CSA37_09415 [Candidatus Fermentibacteria bacterium]|nr:MAG: hypothetical protein CSA37_09415 [Candidatus Fermentibacteria bacterium]